MLFYSSYDNILTSSDKFNINFVIIDIKSGKKLHSCNTF